LDNVEVYGTIPAVIFWILNADNGTVWNQDSSLGTVMMLWAGHVKNQGLSPPETENFSILYSVLISCRFHPASYQICGGSWPVTFIYCQY